MAVYKIMYYWHYYFIMVFIVICNRVDTEMSLQINI